MIEDASEILRLNISRYKRLLQTNLDETTRMAVLRMIAEFEAKLRQFDDVSRRAR